MGGNQVLRDVILISVLMLICAGGGGALGH